MLAVGSAEVTSMSVRSLRIALCTREITVPFYCHDGPLAVEAHRGLQGTLEAVLARGLRFEMEGRPAAVAVIDRRIGCDGLAAQRTLLADETLAGRTDVGLRVDTQMVYAGARRELDEVTLRERGEPRDGQPIGDGSPVLRADHHQYRPVSAEYRL